MALPLFPPFNNCSITICRLKVFENRVLRRVLGLRGTRYKGNGENYVLRSLTICTPYPILCGW
jgi:hypothetical protein